MGKNFKISMFAASILLVGTNVFADTDMETRMVEIEKKMASLENTIKVSETKELNARIDSLETSVLTNKVKFGVGMDMNTNFISGKYSNGTKYDLDNQIYSKFWLNMNSQIDKNIKFTGQLSMNKPFGDSNYNQANYADAMQGRKPGDSSLYVERAYVDYIVNPEDKVPVTFTLGRQPSSNGLGWEYKNNTTRKGTYSSFLFDGATDGIVMTTDLSKVTDIPETAFRVAYGKSYQDKSYSMGDYITGTPLKDTNIIGLFFDTSIPGVDNSLIQLGYVKAKDITLNGVSIDANGNMSTAADMINGGDTTLYGATVELNNILDTKIDMFGNYAVSKVNANGKTVTMTGTPGVSMMDGTGSAYWVGARYTTPFLNNMKIGYEYNHGSKNWINFTQGSSDIFNKLSVRGSVQDVYAIFPTSKHTSLRLGYQDIKYDYTGSGSFYNTIQKTSDVGESLKSVKNTYLNFNLNF